MRVFSAAEIVAKIKDSHPWWRETDRIKSANLVPFSNLRRRRYFALFRKMALARKPNRALLMMGPRRVGKTVLVFQLVRELIRLRHSPQKILFLDLQQPIYNGLGLEELLRHSLSACDSKIGDDLFVIFDEVQYLRNWEVHLKTLVDSQPNIKFIATGSAAAALKLKSNESGAGRFSDFLLPPVTFFEYLDLLLRNDLIRPKNVSDLNNHFVDYLNAGGYPEAIFSPDVRADLGQFIKSDIIDKVLLRDLPSLYGIQDVQELNSLFTVLAYNTANEISLGGLSTNSGVAKNTIKRYIDYLQSAFLIRVVHRIDCNAKKFKRANYFKVYLTNPSMRSALFAPILANHQDMGDLVETAVFAQWFHSRDSELHYSKWKHGEVDIVHLARDQKPIWAVEVKWSDRFEAVPQELASLRVFMAKHPKCEFVVTTRTKRSIKQIDGIDVRFIPASLYCYIVGRNIISEQEMDWDLASDQGDVQQSLVFPD